jgi:hypothetical protein
MYMLIREPSLNTDVEKNTVKKAHVATTNIPEYP